MKRLLLAAMLVAASLSVPATGAQAKYQPLICKSWVSGNGKAFIRVRARHRAVGRWRVKVRHRYGSKYAIFGLAKIGAFQCNKIGPRWSCTVRARPCRKLGFKAP